MQEKDEAGDTKAKEVTGTSGDHLRRQWGHTAVSWFCRWFLGSSRPATGYRSGPVVVFPHLQYDGPALMVHILHVDA